MKISLMQRYSFNETKPLIGVGDLQVQWDECDLSDCPPARGPGTMNAHGKINIVSHDDLPKTFKDTDGNEHLIEDIHYYRSSK
tara:strand:- start:375 stop:623 length:249 start_codon:yes stop_codon:yes gene_type:complete